MNLHRLLAAATAIALTSHAWADNLSPNLKFNGFATAGLSVLSDDHGGSYRSGSGSNTHHNFTEEASALPDSVVGLQFDYQINDQTNLVTQLVAEGQSNYQVRAEWAYIRYALNDNLALRAGRIAFPPFLYSDSRLVGFAYPWARLPSELYDKLNLTSMEGVDLLYRQPIGDWSLSGQFVLGTSSVPGYQIDNGVGANLALNNDDLTLRLGYIQGDVSTTSNPMGLSYLSFGKKVASFGDVGMIYDDGAWFAAAELGQLRFRGYMEDWNSGYVSVGHYFGRWLPYVLWSKTNATSSHESTTVAVPVGPFSIPVDFSSSFVREQSSYAVGVRFDPKPGLALKAQVDRISDFNDTAGLFSVQPDEASYLYSLSMNVSF